MGASNIDALRVSGSFQSSFKCTWNIKNFSFLDSKVGKCHSSDTFRLQESGMEWSLSLYPGGETENSKGYVSCFANVKSELENVLLKFDISLCDTNEKVLTTLKSDEWVSLVTRGYGNSNVIETQNLQSKLIDDILVIVLDVIYCSNYVKDSDGIRQCAETTPALNVVDDLRKLWISKRDADCKTQCFDGIDFHSSVVEARSQYFTKYTRYFKFGFVNFKPPESDGLEDATMNSFLEFIYSGNVHRMNFRLALQLLRASHTLEATDLKLFCSNYLISVLNDNNVCEALVKADECKAEKLRSHAIKYLCKNLTEEGFEPKRSFFEKQPELVRDITKEFDRRKEHSKLAS